MGPQVDRRQLPSSDDDILKEDKKNAAIAVLNQWVEYSEFF